MAGIITKPSHVGAGGIIFLPQRPYMVLGNLRDQITYPYFQKGTTILDNELTELLEQLGLKHVLTRVGTFEARFPWEDILSLGIKSRKY
jgi:ATP-binding cassette subfamily D (ALD) long-chain fatty acid import protein